MIDFLKYKLVEYVVECFCSHKEFIFSDLIQRIHGTIRSDKLWFCNY